jgi:hypothetical protein
VRAEHDAAFEAKDQVLAEGLGGLERPPVEPLGDLRRLGARMGRSDFEPLADEWL